MFPSEDVLLIDLVKISYLSRMWFITQHWYYHLFSFPNRVCHLWPSFQEALHMDPGWGYVEWCQMQQIDSRWIYNAGIHICNMTLHSTWAYGRPRESLSEIATSSMHGALRRESGLALYILRNPSIWKFTSSTPDIRLRSMGSTIATLIIDSRYHAWPI